ncbi:MAG: hypothetical protein JOZ53_09370, partial [Planctomycetaceae bacterium]|nr:hypothetical protein [Planctomycetaceae bacterium]
MSITSGRTSVILVLATLVLPGAGPPEVVRVRVPASKVGAWFPPGTETHGLAADRFEALVRTAREGAARRARSAPPRLLRARHFARWESGVLVGRSELVVEPSAAGPSALVLEPWTPAIEPPADGPTPLRVQDSGRTTLLVEASEVTTLELPWQLLARPWSKGRGFSLGLPATDTASLRLELPEGWVPEGPEGNRQEPDPGPGTGRATWRFDCTVGLIDLRLRARDEGRDPPRDPRIWVSGPTRIELGEASASWTTEWSVSVEPRGPRRFAFELDPGLELIDVNGPGVAESRVEPLGPAARVVVALGRDVTGPTPVTIRATAPVPAEGNWSVPAAWPLDALWTGGVTTVRLDGSRALRDCFPGAGRRIAARPGEPGEANALVFEAEAPRSVATLVFRGPESDASVEVRGQLLLGDAPPRLEGQLTWRVHRGRPLRLDVDLPPGWVPDRLHVAEVDEPVAWHPEALPDGGVRVHVVPPAGDFAGGALVLNLAATSTAAGGPGPLALPRVRPVGVRVAYELWVAWAESGLGLRPTSARGLAWIDPRLVLGPSTRRPEMPTPELEALAWRWITDQAEALVERRRVEVESSGSIHLTATVDPDRLRLDWRIGIEAGGEPLRSLPLAVVGPIAGAREVTFLDEATGMPLARRPLDARRRAAEGLPESGAAWELARPGTGPGRVTIRARLEVPWSGRGAIPLLALPERFQARGLVLVAVNRGLRSAVESRGLRGLDPMVAGRAREAEDQDVGESQPPPDLVAYRWAHAFGTAGANADDRLELRTERLEPSRASGVIGEAILTTYVAIGGASRQHLVLRVVASDVSALEVTLPDGATLARARRDGQAVAPTRLGRGLAIPLAAPQPSRTFSTIVLDYLTPKRPSSDPTTVRPELPATSLPCVGFRWQVVAPEPWVVARSGPGLVPADPVTAPPWIRRPFGSWRGEAGDPSSRAHEAAMLRALDERVVATRPEEVALGEWFLRWDSGTWPLVIDRLALGSAGWGPKSRVLPPRADPARRGAARAAVRPLGLTVVPIGGVLLITTQAEAPDRPGGPLRDPAAREAWETTLREASAWGADRSDRFQSVARWRGEVTPKALASSEADDDSAQAPAGWRVWRFAAPGWPGPDALVRLVDERSRAAWRWAVALAVLVVGIAA